MSMRFRSWSTTGAAVSEGIDVGASCALKEVRFKLSTCTTVSGGATAAGDFLVTLRPGENSTAGTTFFEYELLRQPILNVRSILWQPDPPVKVLPTDTIKITLAAEASAKQWGLDVLFD